MTIVSLPIWLVMAAAGIPGLCLFWLVISLILKKSKSRRNSHVQMGSSGCAQPRRSPNRFQQDLIELQIDAVFNGLVALIETERIKLKALMRNNGLSMASESHDEVTLRDYESDAWENIEVDESSSDRSIDRHAFSGSEPDGMANHLGLSLAEIDLAMKMRASGKPPEGRRLEAVA
jgi:hypothetical protein